MERIQRRVEIMLVTEDVDMRGVKGKYEESK
jgi:hypothetical protein